MKRMICFTLLCCAWTGGAFARAADAPAVIFQIGVSDGDYRELAIAGNYAAFSKEFPHDVDFVAGQDDPGRNWPYVLPGPDDAWAGGKPHTFTIHFQIPQLDSN